MLEFESFAKLLRGKVLLWFLIQVICSGIHDLKVRNSFQKLNFWTWILGKVVKGKSPTMVSSLAKCAWLQLKRIVLVEITDNLSEKDWSKFTCGIWKRLLISSLNIWGFLGISWPNRILLFRLSGENRFHSMGGEFVLWSDFKGNSEKKLWG